MTIKTDSSQLGLPPRDSSISKRFAACHEHGFRHIKIVYCPPKTPVRVTYYCRIKSGLSLFRSGAIGFIFLVIALGASAATNSMLSGSERPIAETLPPYDSPTNGLGSWIWDSKVSDNQTCHFWKAFEIPHTAIKRARLCVTVDNEFTVFLDGRELGRGAEWREIFVFDISALLSPGTHVLGITAFNSSSSAGMLLGLQIDLVDGRRLEIKSDRNWRVVPAGVNGWEKMNEPATGWPLATVELSFGVLPYWRQPDNINIMPTLRPIKVLFWQTGWFQITLVSICCLVILISLRLMAQLAIHQKERRLLREERARIAREIHDDIGARMTQLVLHGEVAQSVLPNGSETQVQIVQLCEEARGLLSTMDEILWAVNPRRDTLRDFAAYVCKYAEDFFKPTQIQCILDVDPELSAAAFDLPLRRSLLMAIKETLNNAVKHSKATELRLQIRWEGQRLVVVVLDNGQGFDPAVVKSERNGFTNISHRILELGGSCLVVSQPGQGCRVEFSIPLRRSHRHLWDRFRNASQFPDRVDEAMAIRADDPSPNHDPAKC
jgi:signal transduction histidine kinase